MRVLPKVLRAVEDRQSDSSLRYSKVHRHQSRDSHPHGPRRPLLVPLEQQVSPQTNALQNDRITREEKKNKNKNKDVHWPVIASLLHNCNLLVHRNRCRNEGNRLGENTSYDWRDCGCFPIISSHLSIIHPPPEEHRMAEYRFKYKFNLYISSFLLFRS